MNKLSCFYGEPRRIKVGNAYVVTVKEQPEIRHLITEAILLAKSLDGMVEFSYKGTFYVISQHSKVEDILENCETAKKLGINYIFPLLYNSILVQQLNLEKAA